MKTNTILLGVIAGSLSLIAAQPYINQIGEWAATVPDSYWETCKTGEFDF